VKERFLPSKCYDNNKKYQIARSQQQNPSKRRGSERPDILNISLIINHSKHWLHISADSEARLGNSCGHEILRLSHIRDKTKQKEGNTTKESASTELELQIAHGISSFPSGFPCERSLDGTVGAG
jgi:hypothetical protein